MKKIAIIGASGQAGKLVTEKAIAKGLDVTAIVRNRNRLTLKVNTVIEKDIFALTREDLLAFDAVVLAHRAAEQHESDYSRVAAHLTTILANSPVWLLIIGGAGSLYLDESRTQRLVDKLSPELPYYPTVKEMAAASLIYKAAKNPWTFFSPADFFDPEGAETGNYSLTNDIFTTNSSGKSSVSYADYADAMVELILTGQHQNEHIGIYEN